MSIVWSDENDYIMLKEIAAEGLLNHKAGSGERGGGWVAVANRMSDNFDELDVTSQAIRDRFSVLSKKHKRRQAAE